MNKITQPSNIIYKLQHPKSTKPTPKSQLLIHYRIAKVNHRKERYHRHNQDYKIKFKQKYKT